VAKYLVRCSYELEVTIPDDSDPSWQLEENACPATGAIGAQLEAEMDDADERGVCWACGKNAKTEVIRRIS
jgi:hypothetical protein